MKHVLRNTAARYVPAVVVNRKDKMGFPVPLTEWAQGEAREFVRDTLSSQKALHRPLIDNKIVLARLDAEPQFSRKLWGLLALEVWQQQFHDRQAHFRSLLSAGPRSRAA
jgi:asparagine synthase (glutamine-hydrolysing)